LDSDVDLLVLAEDGQLNNVAGFQTFNGFSEVSDGLNFLSVDSDNQVG
jgi:hypothetical protein